MSDNVSDMHYYHKAITV